MLIAAVRLKMTIYEITFFEIICTNCTADLTSIFTRFFYCQNLSGHFIKNIHQEMKIKKTISLIALLLITANVFAGEGMWLPQLLQALNEKDMKQQGMKINASDIYSVNKGSLKDAIVSLGGFCTAEVISDQGLLLTNHHCGFDAIQNHSSLEHNYINDGFWSKNKNEEPTNPGLTATFIIRIEDVTDAMIRNVTAGNETDRQLQIEKNMSEFKKSVKKETWQEALIKPMFDGNKYFLFVTETYKDVRLVGAPPTSIGNFGKDTDNWMWPRHTGDFSLFRIYAGKDNHPADYSPENLPYKPKRSLKISLDGVAENDFTMVFGFPGRTTEYLPSAAVAQTMNVTDPIKISIRAKALGIMDEYMRSNEQIKIQYATKYAKMENYYKKWSGEVAGLKLSGAVNKKLSYEAEFEKKIAANIEWHNKYGTVLNQLNAAYKAIEPYAVARDYYNEMTAKIELFTAANQLYSLVTSFEKNGTVAYTATKQKVGSVLAETFGELNTSVDKELFEKLVGMYLKNMPPENVSPLLLAFAHRQNNDYKAMTDSIYATSFLDDSTQVKTLFGMTPEDAVAKLKSDIAIQLIADMQKSYSERVSSKLTLLQNTINNLQRSYMAAQMNVFKEKKFYPDANSTLRVTYGQVKGYEPKDAFSYNYYTYLDGIMQKYIPGDYEFDVPAKLIDLYNKKDFGPYGTKGRQTVCFIATNHTTGGNSGSPALDAYGNLIGLNFDRVWEGTMSDINYDTRICRNIMVDIRYVAFIIDKFAGAKNIIEELIFVHPKRKV